MKTVFILIFFVVNFFNCFCQAPDILVFDHNKNSTDALLRFSFIQLSDVHIGESMTGDDYGTAGYNDTLTGIDTGYDETDANKEFPSGHLRIINVYDPMFGTEKTEKSALSFFPNPANGMLSIDFINSAKRPDVIEIYDMMGKLVYKDEFHKISNQLDLSHLNNGIYIIKSNNLQQFYKLVISKNDSKK